MATTVTTHATPRLVGEAKGVRLYDVASATVIYAGTFACQTSGTTYQAVPASSVADAGDAAANREAAADLFLGVFLDGSANGDTAPVRVAGPGTQIWLKQATAAAIQVGDCVEIYADATNAYDDTVVEGTTSAIAVVVKTKTAADGVDVLCEILPTKIEQALIQS